MSSDLERWWKDLPVLTKYLFVGSFGVTLAANFGLLSPYSLVLIWPKIITEFQLWRLVTCFLFHGKLGFPFLIHMLFLSLESEIFNGRLSDYVWMQVITCSLLLASTLILPSPILGMGLIVSLIYYWSRKNPDVEMSLMFGIRFKSIYFPWVLCAMSLLMGGSPLAELCGIVAGHFYFFFEDIIPRTKGYRLLQTPAFMYVSIDPAEYNSYNRGAQQQATRGPTFTGTGYTLRG
ncbi:Der1like domain family, member 1, putative [Acanthamoeba castellanii str. Neff]|uniref:Derlin n=1 Tax=Acanthamoeba castellanii (strain ATCC 30010 / Neff) TaxID=1257118 RepID=L8HI67_ACACF|nr:Der1like domain family, member 1, putative [Acanthamoeba castellanii str. Neff]ELR25279.1 Der1like domain family, member 1, putative [Acanthamoeba castellanii str. Neff]